LAVLGRAPTPTDAAHLRLAKIRSALKHGGRQRNIDTRAQEIAAVLRTAQLAAPAPLTAAFAATTRAAVGIISELNRQITELETELATHFEFRGPFGTPAHAGKSGAVARRGRCFLAQ
jgi:DNA-binding LacI/PurR family transcriptional regulator